jgi:membrane-associated phospholipid phosphatase
VHYVSDLLGGVLLGLILGLLTLVIYPLWIQWFPFLF